MKRANVWCRARADNVGTVLTPRTHRLHLGMAPCCSGGWRRTARLARAHAAHICATPPAAYGHQTGVFDAGHGHQHARWQRLRFVAPCACRGAAVTDALSLPPAVSPRGALPAPRTRRCLESDVRRRILATRFRLCLSPPLISSCGISWTQHLLHLLPSSKRAHIDCLLLCAHLSSACTSLSAVFSGCLLCLCSGAPASCCVMARARLRRARRNIAQGRASRAAHRAAAIR